MRACFPPRQTFPDAPSQRAAPRRGFDLPQPSVRAGGERVFGFCSPFFVWQLPGLNRLRALAPAAASLRRGAGDRVPTAGEWEPGPANGMELGLGERLPLPSPSCGLADTGGCLLPRARRPSCVPASRGGKRTPKTSGWWPCSPFGPQQAACVLAKAVSSRHGQAQG